MQQSSGTCLANHAGPISCCQLFNTHASPQGNFKKPSACWPGGNVCLVLIKRSLRGHNTLSVGVAKNLAHLLYESNDGT